MTNVNEIVKRIISCYDFSRFEEKDDLIQHANEACFKSIKNFNPNHPKYSSAFNWFSLTAKRSLLNYTLRKKKHRGHCDISDYHQLEYQNNELSVTFIKNNLLPEIIYIIDSNFLGAQRQSYIKMSIILINYLEKTRKFKKTDFYAWARSHGFTNSVCRQYLKDLSAYYKHLEKNLVNLEN